MSTISTIIPTHNYAHYLGEALDSVAAQTLKPAQVIVVDDGSTDDTAQVVESRRASLPALTYIQQAQRGASAARNAGAAKATGDLLHFLDADNVLLPDFYVHLATVLDSHPEHGAACCGCFFCYGSSTRRLAADQCWARELPLVRAMEIVNPLDTSFTLVRRTVFEALGGYNEAFPIVQDVEFACRLVARVPVEISPERHVVYRRHGGGISNTDATTHVERLLRAEAITERDRDTYGILADTYIQYWLAVFLVHAGRLDEAEARLARLLAVSPEHPAGRLLRVQIGLKRGDGVERVRAEAEALGAAFRDCGLVGATLGRVREAAGDAEGAVRLLRHAVEVELDDVTRQQHTLDLAGLLSRSGRREEAAGVLDMVLEEAGVLDDEPDEPFGLRTRYLVASELGRAGLIEEAIAGFERVASSPLCESEGLGAGTRFHLGSLHSAAGDAARARAYFEECLRLNPRHRRAAAMLQALPADPAAGS